MPTAFPQGTQTSQEAQRSPGPQGSPGVAPVPAAARRREREGGRHGRASFPESAADSAIRSRLVRLAAIPCLLVAVICTAVAAFVVQAGGARLTGREWVVLCGGLALVCVIVLTAGAAANSEARAAVARYARLRQVCARSQSDLYDLLDRVRQGEWIQRREPEQGLVPSGDTLDLLAHEVAAAGRAAESAVIDAVAIARSNASGSEQKVEVFVNLARRLQSLVHREIQLLDELENEVEDPDLLKGLFHVDHLATRIRRHAENLAVLGGAISRRQWSQPGLHDRGAALRHRRGRAVPAGSSWCRRSTAPCAATPSPTSSTCSPNSSRTPRCSPPRTPRCCCAPSSSPPGSPSRSRTAASACPSDEQTG